MLEDVEASFYETYSAYMYIVKGPRNLNKLENYQRFPQIRSKYSSNFLESIYGENRSKIMSIKKLGFLNFLIISYKLKLLNKKFCDKKRGLKISIFVGRNS